MILRVDFDQFAPTVKRLTSGDQAYVAPQGTGSLLSALDAKAGVVVMCSASLSVEEATKQLEDQGMKVFPGAWSLDGSEVSGSGPATCLYVAAVAYASEEAKPGLWVDAYTEEPTLAQIMRSMYDEFMADGEVAGDISLEEFIRLANPNVVILSPEQLLGFSEG